MPSLLGIGQLVSVCLKFSDHFVCERENVYALLNLALRNEAPSDEPEPIDRLADTCRNRPDGCSEIPVVASVELCSRNTEKVGWQI